ncbi:hypothetical protein AMTRI_Chr03g49990 [Amborella trichopoda]
MKCRKVILSSLIPVVRGPELERETGERRRGRDVLICIDHSPNSKHAFDWAIVHFCRLADTLHSFHVVSSVNNEAVKTLARVGQGEVGKAICKEATRIKPAAVVMGTRGIVLQGSVGEYCFHNCKSAPIIIVLGKGNFTILLFIVLNGSVDSNLFCILTGAGELSI